MRKRRNFKEQIEAMQKIISGNVPVVKVKKKVVRRNKPNDMREKRLERDILWRLNTYDHLVVWKNGEQATYNSRYILDGMADIGGFNIRDKYIFFMEVKEGLGKQRDSQASFEGLCDMVGIRYFIVYSVSEAENCVLKNT